MCAILPRQARMSCFAILQVAQVFAQYHVPSNSREHQVAPGDDTLQAALDAASDGDRLVLGDGKYTRRSGDNVLEIRKNITIWSQTAGKAILDGEDVRRVIHISSGTVNLMGLVITKGRTANGRGGGVRITGGVVSLNNCEMHTNTGSNRGGALRITGGKVTLNHCNIHSNSATRRTGPRGGGVFINSGAVVHFQSCVIHNNNATSTGGGLFISGSSTRVDLENCSVYENTVTGGYEGDGNGGGISITGGTVFFSTGSIRNNNATSNTGGGLYMNAGDVVLSNCQIHHNEAAAVGAAMAVSRGRLRIRQSQVHHNKARHASALMVSSPEGATVVDGKKYGITRVQVDSTFFYANKMPQIEVKQPAVVCAYRIAGKSSGNGNFTACSSML